MNVRLAAVSALTLALLVSTPARAQDADSARQDGTPTGCAASKWPLDKERQAFEDAGIESISSGAARGGWKDQAFALTLQPETDVPYTLPPKKRKQNADGPRYGAIVAFAAPEKAGRYQVTISGEGWIDLVQQGAPLKSAGHSSVEDCPGLRKSVRFSVVDAPVVLQISSAPGQSIKVAIRPVD